MAFFICYFLIDSPFTVVFDLTTDSSISELKDATGVCRLIYIDIKDNITVHT